MEQRKLFCQICPITYGISVAKGRLIRHCQNFFNQQLAHSKQETPLPHIIYAHQSLIRRQLGQVDMLLQHNKAVNLALAAPKISGILIRPNEIFSFWQLVGNCTESKGYREGLTISNGQPAKGIGGGMCQFTNLIHWMVLHTPLIIVEHHHHNQYDLFPDYNRQVPFGVGTSIAYNYLDYRFLNPTDQTFQLITYTTDSHLCGELRAEKALSVKYHIKEDEGFFEKHNEQVYRYNRISRCWVDKQTGNQLGQEIIRENFAKVMYTANMIDEAKIEDRSIE